MAERLIDVPLESIPFIDEHSTTVTASPDATWKALAETVAGSSAGRLGGLVARGLDCVPGDAAGEIPAIGSTIPGFIVTRSVCPAALALMGEHRFSRYALVFTISERLGEDAVELSAQTRAVFPGRTGTLYRALVIGTRGHVLAVRAILRTVRRRAERAEP
jgi:hypothetical protein